MKSISVIIVSWNACDYLQGCLNSLRQTSMSSIQEVIVVDNASEDGSSEMVEKEFPDVTLIRAGGNLGFARANNLAMKLASSPLLAFVNSDVIVHPGCLETLAKFMDEHANVALVGPRIIGWDGKLQKTSRRIPGVWNTLCRILVLDRLFPNIQLLSGFEMPEKNHDQLSEAEVISGCFCVARKNAVDEVGGMDEQFFFYGEDIDWCKRFRDAGWKLMLVPEATAIHYGGGSTANAPLRYSIEILRATLIYWRKHHGIIGQAVCFLLIALHHGLRLLVRGIKYFLGLGRSKDSSFKLKEDIMCLRWLLTRKGV